ncbi:hypothetical protein MKX01_032209 [Papaver californicum]|nr:hypothetical protein MKX01_032209 [Papaver californicum]
MASSPSIEAVSSAKPKKMITLKTKDNEVFEVEESVVLLSDVIKHIIEDDCADNVIPIPNVSSKTLAKVIEFLNKHGDTKELDEDKKNEELTRWNKEFIQSFGNLENKSNLMTLFEVMGGASFLGIKSLLDVTSYAAANIIKDMELEEVRAIFDIENDFTPEEEAQLRDDNMIIQ